MSVFDEREQLRQIAGQLMSPAARRLLDPSDVVQQAMLRAHQARNGFRGDNEAARQAWLRRILRRTLADMLRDRLRLRRDARREHSIDAGELSSTGENRLADSSRHDPAEVAARREMDGLLPAYLGGLPAEQEFAIREKFLAERSLEDIAAALGRSVPAVAGLIRRGLATLRSRHDKTIQKS
jgi:RNA polymerase sigma-70 factor (ECF subfamily)